MPNIDRAKTIGIAGLVALLASWTVLFFPWRILPSRYLPKWDPSLLILAMIILAGSAVVAGVIAGLKASKWWYFLAGAGFISVAVLLADIAV